MYDALITPIAYGLVSSDRLLQTMSSTLNDEQQEILETIHKSAVETYRLTQEALQLYEAQQIENLAHMLHDLFTPSATLISYCDYLLEDVPGKLPDEARRLVRSIYFRTHKLRRLSFNLVDYARLQSLPDEPLSIVELQHLLQPDQVVIDSDLELRWELPEDLPAVFGNKAYIARSFNNLLSNAYENTDEGLIDVRTRLEDDYVVLRVRDTGRGIPLEKQDAIFEPFVKLDPYAQGLGLGLYVARGYIRALGGDVVLTSAPDRGTAAVMKLPIADPHIALENLGMARRYT